MLILIDLFSWVSPIRCWGGQVYRELIISHDVNDKGTVLDLFHGSASLQTGLLTILSDHSGGGALRWFGSMAVFQSWLILVVLKRPLCVRKGAFELKHNAPHQRGFVLL